MGTSETLILWEQVDAGLEVELRIYYTSSSSSSSFVSVYSVYSSVQRIVCSGKEQASVVMWPFPPLEGINIALRLAINLLSVGLAGK